MIRKLLPSLVIGCLGPMALEPAPRPAMVFDVRRTPTVGEMIVSKASARGVPPHLAAAVAWRESKFQIGALHKNKNGTVDVGVFQLNSHYFPEAPRMSVEENISAGIDFIGEKIKQCRTEAGPVIRFAFTHGRCPK